MDLKHMQIPFQAWRCFEAGLVIFSPPKKFEMTIKATFWQHLLMDGGRGDRMTNSYIDRLVDL
jgi:hypothetical protein